MNNSSTTDEIFDDDDIFRDDDDAPVRILTISLYIISFVIGMIGLFRLAIFFRDRAKNKDVLSDEDIKRMRRQIGGSACCSCFLAFAFIPAFISYTVGNLTLLLLWSLFSAVTFGVCFYNSSSLWGARQR